MVIFRQGLESPERSSIADSGMLCCLMKFGQICALLRDHIPLASLGGFWLCIGVLKCLLLGLLLFLLGVVVWKYHF